MAMPDEVAKVVAAHPGGITAAQVAEALGITADDSRAYLSRLVKRSRIHRLAPGIYGSVSDGVSAVSEAVSPKIRAQLKPVAEVVAFPALGPATATSLSNTLQKVAAQLEIYVDNEKPYRIDAKGSFSPNPAYSLLLGYLGEVRQLLTAIHRMGLDEREVAALEFDALSGFPEFVAWLLDALKPHPEALRDVLVAMSDKGWAGGPGDSGGA